MVEAMVTGVLMSGGAPVPLPDHSSHSTDLDSEAAANTERRCAGPEPRDCAPRSAVCLRARAPRVSAVSVQRSSFLLLVAAGVASLPGQGQGEGEPRLHFIFVFLLTHTILRPNK